MRHRPSSHSPNQIFFVVVLRLRPHQKDELIKPSSPTMSTIGPTLPPHLTSKRKRSVEDADDSERQSRSRSSSTSEEGKRRKVLGPSLPSKSIREESTGQSTNGGQESNSESDDDIGPAPAPPEGQSGGSSEPQNAMPQAVPDPEKPGKHLQREEWMLAPPSNVDWTSRIDPTKLKNRRFNTGKGARAPVQTDTTEDTLWTESPAEKTKRLQNEVMGIVDLKTTERPKERSSKATSGEAETRRKIEEHRVSCMCPLPLS